jgi:pyruvate/2-oxoglutarate dehydrogenase complex dihydrolipoamide acyltransferase (E2) component
MSRHDIALPDLGFGKRRMTVSLWLVPRGGRVKAGEPVIEILCGSATVDLPAPSDGVLVEKCATEDAAVAVGQRLGVIEDR